MVQGFYFSNPESDINFNPELDTILSNLISIQRAESKKQTRQLEHYFYQFNDVYKEAIEAFINGGDLSRSAEIIFSEERAIRCFLLDEAGYQIGSSIHAASYK